MRVKFKFISFYNLAHFANFIKFIFAIIAIGFKQNLVIIARFQFENISEIISSLEKNY